MPRCAQFMHFAQRTHLQVRLGHDDHEVDEEGDQRDVLGRVEHEPRPDEDAVARHGRPQEERVRDHQHDAQRHRDGQEVAGALQSSVHSQHLANILLVRVGRIVTQARNQVYIREVLMTRPVGCTVPSRHVW